MMKKKIFIGIALLILSCPFQSALAEEQTFGAGSLIIPMDSFYQPEADGGLLEAYGLIFYLLKHKDDDDFNDIMIYWVINGDKIAIDGIDLVINDLTLGVDEAVVGLYDHAGGTTALTFNTADGDSDMRISYSGSLFVVDEEDAETAKAIINESAWDVVDVHEAQVTFSAPVQREMQGVPPRIALMNSDEDKTKGNAQILEAYMRLAGLGAENYAVVTPNEIAGIDPAGNPMPSILRTGGFDFLWAPHWDGYKHYDGDADGDTIPDVDEIVEEIQKFLKSGKALFAECASIETFEFNAKGRFLTPSDIGHNLGSNNPDWVIYNDVTSAYAQVGDLAFSPEGGHLHNWSPIGGYVDGVTRFTVDDTNQNGTVGPSDWDYFVGGNAYGHAENGYVVYLGGHSYAKCEKSVKIDPQLHVHTLDLKFKKDISGENFTLLVDYKVLTDPYSTQVTFTKDDLTAIAGSPLEIDLNTASVKKRDLRNVTLTNTGVSPINIDSIILSWTDGDSAQELEKVTDNLEDKIVHFDENPGAASGDTLSMTDFTIVPDDVGGGPVLDNDDCTMKNVAAIRYVLNTLFHIKFQIRQKEYVRAAPVVKHPYLYQGSFEYPSNVGHFRRYDVTDSTDDKVPLWDTAEGSHIVASNNTNSDGRKIYTSDVYGATFSFDSSNIDNLRGPLDVSPADGDDTGELAVITRVRGKYWNYEDSQWQEMNNHMGGVMHSAPAIVDSNSRTGSRTAMAYVGDIFGMLHAIEIETGDEKWVYIPRNLLGKLKNDRNDPDAVQNFAAVDGSPTAKDIYYDHDGDGYKEWRTILISPEGQGNNYIFALDVTDPDNWSVVWELTVEPILSYSGTGGFPAGVTLTGITSGATGEVVEDDPAKYEISLKNVTGTFQIGEDVFYDKNDNGTLDVGATPELDVEVTHIVKMGYAYRAAIGKLAWPVRDVDDYDGDDDRDEIIDYELKWVVYVATGFFLNPTEHGGINVFALDFETGERLWHFSDKYFSAHNDIPGAVTLFDTLGDGFADRVFVGDMDGRLWELDAETGSNPNGTGVVSGISPSVTKPIPLWNAGTGYPISVSPTVVRINPVIVIFGTGGADWALDTQTYSIYAVNATDKQGTPSYDGGAGSLLWKEDLAEGEKVWSSPTVAGDLVFVATSKGTMESDDPGQDLEGDSKLRAISYKTGTLEWSMDNIGKVRGSLYVDRQHVYLTTNSNEVIQIGDENFSPGGANGVKLKAWKQLDD